MNKNIYMIKIIATGLKHLIDKVVFTGGATVSLYLDDKGASEPRPTDDVDCVIEVTPSGFYKFEEELRKLGFIYAEEKDVPICRWKFNKIKVDFMPTDKNVLGFKNIWYKKGVKEAINYKIDKEQSIKIFPAAIFIASKLEAFKGRGQDPRTSQDIEDIITILNGYSKILEDIKSSDKDVKKYLKLFFSEFSSNKNSISEIIYSHLPPEDKERVGYIKNIIEGIVRL